MRLTIQIEGCPPLIFEYIKKCGTEFRPHPGVVIQMTVGQYSSTREEIIRDGIIRFDKQSAKQAVDKIIHNFQVDSDSLHLFISAEIGSELQRIFDLEAGNNQILKARLKEKALFHQMLPPVLSYDESIIQVLATGSLKPGVSDLTPSHPHEFDLQLRCMVKADAYINIVFPMKDSESISFIIRRSCTQSLEPLASMTKESQQNQPQKIIVHQNAGDQHTATPVDDRAKHSIFFSILILLGLGYAVIKLHEVGLQFFQVLDSVLRATQTQERER